MNAERWQRIDKLLEAVLEREPGQRANFLDGACAGDEELRREVQALLAAHEQAGSFIEEPALGAALKEMTEHRKQSLVGQQLGSYKILSSLGAGGMGEVYLAQDSRLGRKIALKILPTQFTQDKDRVRRFEREARAASALNHPNILTIHEIGQADGTTFIATEFIDGQTLRQRMQRGRQELSEMLEIGIQIASALAAAHESHIVHRDIKPENIMLRLDGYVKVLDFGLAKLTESHAISMGSQESGMVTLSTETGMMLGTAHYMSPEQAMGREVDHRTDIFSLGAVLYEMASGTPPFKGPTIAAIFDAILHQTPTLPRQSDLGLPEELERIITKTLEKDREMRYQTALDLRADLKRLEREVDSEPGVGAVDAKLASRTDLPRRAVSGRRSLALVAVLAVLLIAAGLGWYFWRPSRPEPEVKQRQLTTNSSEAPVTTAAISPDGKYLAFADENGITLRLIDTGERHPLTVPASLKIRRLAWFPDGTKLLASGVIGEERMPRLWTISILGGPPRKLRDDAGIGSVSPDGSQVAFVRGNGREIWLMGSNGQEPRRLLARNEGDPFRSLLWFPDGQRLGYVRRMDVESCDLKGSSVTRILSGVWMGDICLLSDGRMIYSVLEPNAASLWEISKDVQTGKAASRPRRIINWLGFSVDGLSVSRDGKRLAFVKGTDQTDVYVGELEQNRRRMKIPKRLTFDDRNDFPGAWTTDSKAVLFTSDRNGNLDIFKQALGQRFAEPVVVGPEVECDPTVSPDGSWILYFALPGGARLASAKPVSLKRTSIAGGPPQLVLNEQGFSIVHCARSPSNLCVVDQRSHGQLVFYSFDPLQGKGREVTRTDIPPKAYYFWDLSPDGSRIAVTIHGEQNDHIRILSFGGVASRDVKVDGWTEIQDIKWSADGEGWFVLGQSAGSEALLYVDIDGHAQVLWQQPIGPLSFLWGIPSPDGRYLAFPATSRASNAWLMENF